MIDSKLLRENFRQVEAKIKSKDADADVQSVFDLDERLRKLKTELEQLKSLRNDLSKKIGDIKRTQGNADSLMHEVAGIAARIDELEAISGPLEKEFDFALAKNPNLPMDDIKVAESPSENVCIKEWGKRVHFSFPFKNHVELNEKLHLFDFVRGAKISGAGWPVYRGVGAQLEWALINYMLSIHIKNGFTQWMVPHLVREEIAFGAGQLPKFSGQQFRVTDEDYNLYLIPTAEVPLTGLHYDEILSDEELPKLYCAYTPCFRREAGAAGASERGLNRVHQFNKVEMYALTTPEESPKVFDLIVASAEEILQGLNLHYRNMLLVTGDMSFASARTVDVEVWLPGQNRYYEVSSISNCTDYQARRSKIRFRRKGEKPTLVHTLNGSGLATSRLMVALLENNQNEDGSVNIPDALQPYLGKKMISPLE